MTLAAGTRLGSYVIVAPLGAGNMGEVYRARDTVLKRDVRLKYCRSTGHTIRNVCTALSWKPKPPPC
jgi:hypothetical protein